MKYIKSFESFVFNDNEKGTDPKAVNNSYKKSNKLSIKELENKIMDFHNGNKDDYRYVASVKDYEFELLNNDVKFIYLDICLSEQLYVSDMIFDCFDETQKKQYNERMDKLFDKMKTMFKTEFLERLIIGKSHLTDHQKEWYKKHSEN